MTEIIMIDPMLPIYVEAYRAPSVLDQAIMDVIADAVRNCDNTMSLDDLDKYIEEMLEESEKEDE